MRRVVIVLADGLRPDAISPTHMPSLDALSRAYTMALHAKTVRPSRTAAALTSLATGIAPSSHGLIEPGLAFLGKLITLRPLGRELERAGLPSHIVSGEMNPAERAIVWALVSAAGIGKFTARGRRARDVAAAALAVAREQRGGVLFVYLNDADIAGHAHGWMSPQYLAAAAESDTAVGVLSGLADDSLLIVLADHGGGGVTEHDHAEPHPMNDRIPLILAGPDVTRRHQLTRAVSLLDVPATVLWWAGVEVPASYEGRVLSQAFTRVAGAAGAAV
jgi:predicted AlkP superfamily pyrophosphatase or phosphodiesterase